MRRAGRIGFFVALLWLAAGAQNPWRAPDPWRLTLFGGWPYQPQLAGRRGELGAALGRDLNRWLTFSPRVTWYRLGEPGGFTAACIASPSLPCANYGADAWTFEGDMLVSLRFGQRWVVPYIGGGFGLAVFTGASSLRRYQGMGDFLAGARFRLARRWALRPELRLGNHQLSSLALGLSYSF